MKKLYYEMICDCELFVKLSLVLPLCVFLNLKSNHSSLNRIKMNIINFFGINHDMIN